MRNRQMTLSANRSTALGPVASATFTVASSKNVPEFQAWKEFRAVLERRQRLLLATELSQAVVLATEHLFQLVIPFRPEGSCVHEALGLFKELQPVLKPALVLLAVG